MIYTAKPPTVEAFQLLEDNQEQFILDLLERGKLIEYIDKDGVKYWEIPTKIFDDDPDPFKLYAGDYIINSFDVYGNPGALPKVAFENGFYI